MIETDCGDVVDLLMNNGWTDEHQEGDPLTEIQRWIEGEWHVSVAWCSRSANQVADIMAKYALSMAEGIVFINQPPDFVSAALRKDSTT